MKYSPQVREAALRKLCAPHGPSLNSVARELGIAPGTLRKWRKFGHQKLEDRTVNQVREQDWSMEKRFEVVIETSSMSDEELGAYCRRQGLHVNTVALWREKCLNTIRNKDKTDREKATLKRELKETKKDLKRKEKALAEASARLILQKKAKELWGSLEEEKADL